MGSTITPIDVLALTHYVAWFAMRQNRRMVPGPPWMDNQPLHLQKPKSIHPTRISLELDDLTACVQQVEKMCHGSVSLGITTTTPSLDDLWNHVDHLRNRMVKLALPPVSIQDEPIPQTEITWVMVHRLVRSIEDIDIHVDHPLAPNSLVAILAYQTAIMGWALPRSIEFTPKFLWLWAKAGGFRRNPRGCEGLTQLSASISPPFHPPFNPSFNLPPSPPPSSSSTYNEKKEEEQGIEQLRSWRTKVRNMLVAFRCM